MKLLTRTSIYYIAFSTIGFLVGGILFYFFVSRIIYNRTDDTLITEKELIEEQIANSDQLPDFSVLFGHQIEVTIYNNKLVKHESLKDTTIYDTISAEWRPFRHLSTTDSKGGKTYSIDIYKPLLETNQLVADISLVLLLMFLVLLVVLVLVNYFISRNIWHPFYITINELRKFSVENESYLNFESTRIKEFRQLNKTLRQMSARMRRDYLNLKEFTENISHELQTPLAIIKSKLELLVQNENLDEDQMNLIGSIYDSISRLSRLNQALNLIAKIDNHQFHQTEECNISEIVEKNLKNLDDVIGDKHLTIVKNIDSGVNLKINRTLAEILFSNLIANSIKHNIEHGKISIVLNNDAFTISNTGLTPAKDPMLMFHRFQKSDKSSNSLGLGLSIVYRICSQYQFEITYRYKSEFHTLAIFFEKK